MPYSGTGKKGEMITASELRETVATEYDVTCRWNLKMHM